MRGNLYQFFLIALATLVTVLFGVFLYRELTPEYKIYQKDYVALEEFRSTYTGEPPPQFKEGIKQIVLTNKNKGPEEIDRCVSCHVALTFEHFSPTKVAYDFNGQVEYDANGIPKQVPNENYVWKKLDEKIQSLRNEEVNKKLESEGKGSEVTRRLAEAAAYESLKIADVGHHTYNVEKVLMMHPLIGKETRPFELHPIEEYGCVSCHGGNGRGLTTDKAHGPVFDGDYEIEDMGPTPAFLERDPQNDPRFASVFNHKPGHELLFQTTPILVGSLIEAKCVQCHNSSSDSIKQAYRTASTSIDQRRKNYQTIESSYKNDLIILAALLQLQNTISENNVDAVLGKLEEQKLNYNLSPEKLQIIQTQAAFLKKNQAIPNKIQNRIDDKLLELAGSESALNQIKKLVNKESSVDTLRTYISNHTKQSDSNGSLFAKARALAETKDSILQIQDTKQNFSAIASQQSNLSKLVSHVDLLTKNYRRGEELFISQACYACHRIEGLSRGGIGPELTEEGNKYPWFVKESIVWPQADLKSSTMPNFHLDHDEVEDLTTFLLAQTGKRKYESETAHKIAMVQWEAGAKNSWEEPLKPSQMHNLDDAMEIFATQGCAACHRLKGFQSDIGFTIEKDKNVDDKRLLQEKEWFNTLFPEEIPGSQIVDVIEKNKVAIDQKISNGIRSESLLERLQDKDPESISQFYSNFKYAFRAKNHLFDKMVSSKIATAEQVELEKKAWHNLVQKVLMVYVQEYGLGRLIGPRPNWSGVYRSDKWLMEHFFNPSGVVRRSIMPVMPFDQSKFYALTYMLDVLGIRNRDELRRIWTIEGFNPEKAYQTLCAQCHGDFLQGNGPVSEWIYPIPKNLRSADFLRNLTREKAYESIVHGVQGTPMPPWGEIPTDKQIKNQEPVLTKEEIVQIVDWIFSSLPGGSVIRSSQEVPKWQYSPENVIEELKRERSQLNALPSKNEQPTTPLSMLEWPEAKNYYASLKPSLTVNNEKNIQDDRSSVEKIFDVVPIESADPTIKNHYYIKRKYYTPENLKAGQEYFELNCAVCHGREADGAGNRAPAMVDAKPRMLTNLAWLESKDDLRLIRSIKYGVSGTSMVAWGDQTTSLQRLQLVMFIRSLSADAKKREELMNRIYATFNHAQYILEDFRIQLSPRMIAMEKKLQDTTTLLDKTQRNVERDKNSTTKAVQLYQQMLTEKQALEKAEETDTLLQEIITEVNRQKQLLQDLGLAIIGQKETDIDYEKYYELIELLKDKYSIQNGSLVYKPIKADGVEKIAEALKNEINAQIEKINRQKNLVSGKIASPQVKDEIQNLTARINSLNTLKNKISTFIVQALRSQQKQQTLVNELNANLSETQKTNG